MKTARCAAPNLTSTWPSEHLRGAALAGLLCLATVACSSDDDASGAAGSAGTAGEQGLAGTGAGGFAGAAHATAGAAGAGAEGGAASAGGAPDVAGGMPTTVGGASNEGGVDAGGANAGGANAGGAEAGGAGGASSAVEPAHITSSQNVGVLSEEQFKALCDERGGTVEVMPHCGGFATAAGFSYDSGTQLLSEHTCAGANTCGGWNCVIAE